MKMSPSLYLAVSAFCVAGIYSLTGSLVVLVAAYPLLSPLVSMDILGFPLFSDRAPHFQDLPHLAVPLMLGALACLFLSPALSPARIHLPGQPAGPPKATRNSDLLVWLAVAAAGVVFFAWLSDPSFKLLGVSSYMEMREERLDSARFASGAWVVLFLFALLMYSRLSDRKNPGVVRNAAGLLFWPATLLSSAWLIAHARRAEPVGLFVLLLCVFGDRISFRKKAVIFSVTFVLLTLVGYVRSLLDPSTFLSGRLYFTMPGGAENVLIGFLSSVSLVLDGLIDVFPGATYLGHLLRLPPSFLVLDRPPMAYDLVNEQTVLVGREYYLLEPFMNFGALGVVFCLVLFALAMNWSVAKIGEFWLDKCDAASFLLAGVFLVMLFRTLWYGIKVEIIAMMVAFSFLLLRATVLRSRSGCVATQHV